MKNSILIILFSFTLTACIDSDRKTRGYILENNSNRSLELRFYYNKALLGYKTKVLENNGEQFDDAIVDYSNELGLFGLPFRAFEADSIVIEFGNLKRTSYSIDLSNQLYSEPIDRNIFKHENYENIGGDKFLFLITEEDYNLAEDIN